MCDDDGSSVTLAGELDFDLVCMGWKLGLGILDVLLGLWLLDGVTVVGVIVL